MTREEKLLRLVSQGDSEAVEELTGLIYPQILNYCLWHTPNRESAEDAAQETFLKAIRYYDRQGWRGSYKAFLFKIAANTCIDMARKRSSQELSLEELEIPQEEAAFSQIHSDLAFQQMLRCLSQEQRELVLLRFGQELSLRQISQVLGLPLRTVQSRLRSALKKLKQQLEKQETGGIL